MSTKKLQIIGGSILQPDWEETDPTFVAYIRNKPNLPTAALTGSYNDLKDKPTIDTSISESSTNAVSSGAVYDELALKANIADLSLVATSGNYEDLNNKPDIGNETTAGITKLYNGTGDNTDGAMTQKAATNAIVDNTPKIKNVTLDVNFWEGDGPYTQALTVTGVTANSKIDLQADSSVIKNIVNGEFSLTIKNDNGVISAYAVGKKPTITLTLQLIITEVVRSSDTDTVWGNPLVGTGMSACFKASKNPPADINYLWIDTGRNNLLKYYNGATWVAISGAWG